MKLLVRRIDTTQFEVSVPEDASVPALKQQILREQNIPVENQRIIYQGRVLKDDKHLRDYNLSEGSVLHMVDSPPPPVPPQGSVPVETEFAGMMPAGLMMGAIRLEGNTDDPNLSQNIIAAITQAMQAFAPTMARASPSATTVHSTEGVPETLINLLGQMETLNAFLTRNVPSVETVTLEDASDAAPMRAYSRLVQNTVSIIKGLESCLLGTIGPVRRSSPPHMATLLTAAASMQQAGQAMQSLSSLMHSLIQHRGNLARATVSTEEREPSSFAFSCLHWVTENFKYAPPSSNLSSYLHFRNAALNGLIRMISSDLVVSYLEGPSHSGHEAAARSLSSMVAKLKAKNPDLMQILKEEFDAAESDDCKAIVKCMAELLDAMAEDADPWFLQGCFNDKCADLAKHFAHHSDQAVTRAFRHFINHFSRILLPMITAFAIDNFPWADNFEDAEVEDEAGDESTDANDEGKGKKRARSPANLNKRQK